MFFQAGLSGSTRPGSAERTPGHSSLGRSREQVSGANDGAVLRSELPGLGRVNIQVLIPYSTSGNSFFSQKSYSPPALKQIFREYNSLSPHLILLIMKPVLPQT